MLSRKTGFKRKIFLSKGFAQRNPKVTKQRPKTINKCITESLVISKISNTWGSNVLPEQYKVFIYVYIQRSQLQSLHNVALALHIKS